ncbi:MAG: hypothetical protein KDD38_10825, partial [Bdellovibrionales bacterium]|nr:hypothetical protein [Bdellovibrionales bacterium]
MAKKRNHTDDNDGKLEIYKPLHVRLAAIFVAFIVFITFFQIIKFDFLNLDDQAHIEKNEALKNFDLLHIWTHEHKDMFIPALYSTLSLEALISPRTPTFTEP